MAIQDLKKKKNKEQQQEKKNSIIKVIFKPSLTHIFKTTNQASPRNHPAVMCF